MSYMKKRLKILGALAAIVVVLVCSLFLYVKYEEAPIESEHFLGYYFVLVNTDCSYCISGRDSVFLEGQSNIYHKDTIQLETDFRGIEGIGGIIRYEEDKYVNFVNGYNHVYYYVVIGRFFFGPFKEKLATS